MASEAATPTKLMTCVFFGNLWLLGMQLKNRLILSGSGVKEVGHFLDPILGRSSLKVDLSGSPRGPGAKGLARFGAL